MLVIEEIEINGRKLIKTYSNENFYITQNETGNKYVVAVDVPEAIYTYTETSEKIPEEQDTLIEEDN